MIKPGMFISDRYEIIEKVGSGGMADVYKARCHRLNRFVAIKVLKSEYSDDKNFVAKFRAEAQSVAGLSNPNIVNVYDVGEDNGLYYIVMELVDGITLKNFIERKSKLEIKEAVGIAIQIAQGLEAAHENHIIHRDIKPQNIIISREGKVKVTDFGIAKAPTSNTITSNTMGSVHYISPEQARGGYSDEKSDIYSLGVTLYEMLCGKVPFTGDNTVSVAVRHLQEEAVPLRQIDQSIPISIEQIVMKCMQKKPERRYLSASELIQDLRRSISNPDGGFVKVSPVMVDDSPTIHITDDEVGRIKQESKINQRKSYDSDLADDENKRKKQDNYQEKENDLDNEEQKDIDPKLEKFLVIGSIAAAVILALIIIVLAGKAFGFFDFGKKENKQDPPPVTEQIPDNTEEEESQDKENTQSPKMIDVTNKPYDEALKLLEDVNITVGSPVFKEDDTVEKNYVITQSVPEGSVVESGNSVVLTVSSGQASFELPDVTDTAKGTADQILTNAKLVVSKHESEYDDKIQEGNVIRTSPPAGTKVKAGDAVTVYVSSGRKIVMKLVPDLRNLTQEEAVEKLKKEGLKTGTITLMESEEVKKGLVINQSTSVGQEVEEGTAIDFTVSKGAKVKEYVYKGSVTIDKNPFLDPAEEGTITLELEQDGISYQVYESLENYDSFPLTNISITGTSESPGTIRMYLDGQLCPGKWGITFTKAEKE